MHDRFRTLVYLPFNDPPPTPGIRPRSCECPGVVGFMVTSVR